MAKEVDLKQLEKVSGGNDGSETKDLNGFYFYTVKKGDTLGKIAKRKGTTVEALMTINPLIENKNLIRIGWRILVPDITKKK